MHSWCDPVADEAARTDVAVLMLAMVFTCCWGVVQLAVLGQPTRSVRLGTLFLAAGLGFYGCGVLAVALEYAVTRVWAGATGQPLNHVVEVASYTVDPFVEEAVKVLPLLILAYGLRGRLQRAFLEDEYTGPQEEPIAVSFVENLPYPNEPAAGVVELLGPRLRAQLIRQRGALYPKM
ncbi:hypothetical protein KIH74_09000 [Kineosporia sp. J2-2]|uniref:Uncharacterized protein n=1 Tax=Kineosporia corallincola TaxID=2835133 RepID=A0ABS5TFU6_9ACTN|nr:hypothetical protein [Kineosporia corallincola]MBT0769061.1 hypothetical protein [Kineosporia corallincola]